MTKISQVIALSILNAFVLVSVVGCGGDDNSTNPDNKTAPVVTTAAVSAITDTTAQCGGNVTSDGGATVSARGVCWSKGATPTVADSVTIDGSGAGSFVSSLTNLTADTQYHVRAYATNTVGTGYGEVRPFQTESAVTGTVTDVDGNTYETVKIGNQWWMAENLRVTHYRGGGKYPTAAPGTQSWMNENSLVAHSSSGDAIPLVTDDAAWSALASGAYCYYNNDGNNADIYGCLYNWYALTDSREIAPLDWRVPTDADWQTLINFVGGRTVAGGALKEVGTAHWASPNTGATDAVGFAALPGGYRLIQGDYRNIGNVALLWSSTEDNSSPGLAWAWYQGLYNTSAVTNRMSDSKKIGMSVRCVRD